MVMQDYKELCSSSGFAGSSMTLIIRTRAGGPARLACLVVVGLGVGAVRVQ